MTHDLRLPLNPIQKQLRSYAEQYDQCAGDDEHGAEAGGNGAGYLGCAGLEVHGYDDAEVVVNTYRCHKQRKYHQPHQVALLHHGEQHIILSHETACERDAGKGEQEYGGGKCQRRLCAGQAVETIVSEVLELYQHSKQAYGGYAVGHGINDDALPCKLIDRQHGKQHEACLCYGGVGKHALYALLEDGGDIAHQQRGCGDDGEDKRPVLADTIERHLEQAQECKECRCLNHGRHVGGERCGRAVIYIGRPHVHGGCRHLEGECEHDEQDTCQCQRVQRIGMEHGGDLRNVEAAGGAKQQGDAHEQDAGGEGAHEEVLQRGLGALQVLAVGAGKYVLRYGEYLDTDEHHEQIVVRRKEVETAEDKENESKVFGHVAAHALNLAGHKQHIKQGAARHHGVEPHGVVPDVQHFVEHEVVRVWRGTGEVPEVNAEQHCEEHCGYGGNGTLVAHQDTGKHHHYSENCCSNNCFHISLVVST